MLRLTQNCNSHNISIVIEGDLKDEGVGLAETACMEALSMDVEVIVFIKNVTEIDNEGHAFLKRLSKTKAKFRAEGIYSRHIIKSLSSSRASNKATTAS